MWSFSSHDLVSQGSLLAHVVMCSLTWLYGIHYGFLIDCKTVRIKKFMRVLYRCSTGGCMVVPLAEVIAEQCYLFMVLLLIIIILTISNTVILYTYICCILLLVVVLVSSSSVGASANATATNSRHSYLP